MRYAQIRLSDKDFITAKKAALDANMSFEDFLKSAMFEKLFSDVVKKVNEEKDSPSSQTPKQEE